MSDSSKRKRLVAEKRYPGKGKPRPKKKTPQKATRKRGAARSAKRPRRSGPIGWLGALFRWFLRLIWKITWRTGFAALLVLGLAVGYIYTTLPPLEALLDGRARGSVTMLDRDGRTFAWRGDQFGGAGRRRAAARPGSFRRRAPAPRPGSPARSRRAC